MLRQILLGIGKYFLGKTSASIDLPFPPLSMGVIAPFIVLLIVALVFNYIPMEGQLKRIGYIIIGIIAIVMLLRLAGIF